MATSKPKSTTAKEKAATSKAKIESTKSKSVSKPKTTAKTDVKAKAEPEAPVETKKVEEVKAQKSCFSGFFARKYEEDESILTIFKKPKLYGALIGEIFGALCLTLMIFSLSLMGIYNLATYAFGFIAIIVAVFAFSGANLNPIVTVGMMASRRMSVIRGVLYIIAQVIGAWLGWLIFNAFNLAGSELGLGYEVPQMATVEDGTFWIVTLIELFGAIIIGFFFARALAYKRSVFTFAAIVTGGMVIATLVGYVVSAAYVGLSDNFIFNPAVALMYQIFPTSGASFGEVFGGICSALATYAVFPMAGGVVGFYLSDFAGKLSGE